MAEKDEWGQEVDIMRFYVLGLCKELEVCPQ